MHAESAGTVARPDSDQVRAMYQPVVARSRSIHSAITPAAYDCIEVTVVRSGSAILFSEFGHQPVKPGDVILESA